VRVRAGIIRTKGHVYVLANPLGFPRAATFRTQRAATERPHVFAEIPPLIAEQATRLALWMSTAKQSFVLKINKHVRRIVSAPS